MDEYNLHRSGGDFLYGGGFHLQPSDCYDESDDLHRTAAVKTEAGASIVRGHENLENHHHRRRHQESGSDSGEVDYIKAKIIAHPQYSNLLEAYMDCQKVGAPPEVVARMAAVREEFVTRQQATAAGRDEYSKDLELDQFMEAYYNMLIKYQEELIKPLQEAMDFMRRIELQLNVFSSEDKSEDIASSEEHRDNNVKETGIRAQDQELKNQLLEKYSGYLSNLKHEFSKKKKKGKLPKEARLKLLNWWELHYKWPYPSESEKVDLAESTGLDQKQINNWFINQRKRHWKPSDDMQFMAMNGLNPQNEALNMEGHCAGVNIDFGRIM